MMKFTKFVMKFPVLLLQFAENHMGGPLATTTPAGRGLRAVPRCLTLISKERSDLRDKNTLSADSALILNFVHTYLSPNRTKIGFL